MRRSPPGEHLRFLLRRVHPALIGVAPVFRSCGKTRQGMIRLIPGMASGKSSHARKDRSNPPVTGMTMDKIRICHVITRMDWGGSPELVRMLCEGLSPERFEVTLVTGPTLHPSVKTAAFFARFRDRITVVPALKREIGFFSDCRAFFALYRLFRRRRFDIVHTHTAKAGFLGRAAALFAGCRCIVHTSHGHNFYGYFGPAMSAVIVMLERVSAAYTRKLVMLTELEKRDHIAYRICGEGKTELIFSCLEPEYLLPPEKSREEIARELGTGERIVVGMVGRLEPVKGPGFFVDACVSIAAEFPGVSFLVTGEGSLRAGLEARAAASGFKDRFIFTGWREDIRDVLSLLTVLVLPSLNEALGLILLQAQAQGVAVVASGVGGVAEAVKDGETAILVPPADSAAIAAALRRLLSDPAAAKAMGEKGRAWVAGRFNIDRMIRSHEEMYARLQVEGNAV